MIIHSVYCMSSYASYIYIYIVYLGGNNGVCCILKYVFYKTGENKIFC